MSARNLLFVSQAANLYGSERTLLTLIEAGVPSAILPLVMCPETGPLVGAVKDLGIKCIPWQFNGAKFLANPVWHGRFFLRFIRLLRALRPLAVIIVYEGNVPLIVASCRAANTPVFRILQIGRRPQQRCSVGGLTDELAFRLCDGVFCGASVLQKQIEKVYGLGDRPPRPVVPLPLRTAVPKFGLPDEWRRRYGIPPRVPLVGQFSRIHPVKGLETLMRAAKFVIHKFPDTHFAICGDCENSEQGRRYKVSLNQFACSLEIDGNFHLTGYVDDVFTGILACDVVALPSYAEGLPISCLEAFAVGKPIVGSDVDGLGEAIRESGGGLLINAGNSAALGDSIAMLLSDESLRRNMGERGRKWVYENCAPAIFRKKFWTAFFGMMAKETGCRYTS